MKKIIFQIALISAFSIVFSACKKEEGCTDVAASNYNAEAEKDDGSCEYPPTANDSAMFKLQFMPMVGAEKLEYGKEYTDAVSGHKYRFTLAQFYVSKISLKDEAKQVIASFPDVYLLVKPDETIHEIGRIGAGHVHELMFNVGIDPATNGQSENDFASWPAGHPLGLQNPSMAWTWNTGYIFLKVEGYVDTANTGNFDKFFWAHSGLDELLQTAEITMHSDAQKGQDFLVKLKADFGKVFTEGGVANPPTTHTMGGAEKKNSAKLVIEEFTKSIEKMH